MEAVELCLVSDPVSDELILYLRALTVLLISLNETVLSKRERSSSVMNP